MHWKESVKDLTPPVLLRIVRRLRQTRRPIPPQDTSWWSGDYASWRDAQAESEGYDTQEILTRVKEAAVKVKRGEAAFERDSVAFAEPDYNWPLLGSLLYVASRSEGRLNVLDFGGSLGSSYFQNLPLLKHLTSLRWSVVEQLHFVTCGISEFQDEHLRFFATVEECIQDSQPDILLLSGVLPYLEHPHEFLEAVLRHPFRFVLIDRTALIPDDRDRLTLQRVPERICSGSYPCWFISRNRLMAHFSRNFRLLAEFRALDEGNTPVECRGFLFERETVALTEHRQTTNP